MIQPLSKEKDYTMKYIDIDIVRKLFFVNIRFHEGKFVIGMYKSFHIDYVRDLFDVLNF